jgi:hypothetical protein
MWPKSSDSSSVSGTAPQLRATNGCSRRSEFSWMARATISLPVPDSPVTSTVLLVLAMVPTIWKSASIAGLRPMTFDSPCCACRARFSRTFSSFSRRASRCWRIFSRSSSTLNGLVR